MTSSQQSELLAEAVELHQGPPPITPQPIATSRQSPPPYPPPPMHTQAMYKQRRHPLPHCCFGPLWLADYWERATREENEAGKGARGPIVEPLGPARRQPRPLLTWGLGTAGDLGTARGRRPAATYTCCPQLYSNTLNLLDYKHVESPGRGRGSPSRSPRSPQCHCRWLL